MWLAIDILQGYCEFVARKEVRVQEDETGISQVRRRFRGDHFLWGYTNICKIAVTGKSLNKFL